MNSELNYKKAYCYLFKKVTNIIQSLNNVQIKAEEFCICEDIESDISLDTEQVLKNMTDYIKNQTE